MRRGSGALMTASRRSLSAWLVALAAAATIVAAVDRVAPRRTRGGRPGAPAAGGGGFEVKPYLQPGDRPGGLDLLWQTADADAAWSVEVRPAAGGGWVAMPPPTARRVAVDGVAPFRLYRTALAPPAADPQAGF